MSPIRVLVVDDSAFMRQVISSMLEADPDISVVGVARDGEDAFRKLERTEPHVLTLDLEMPKMDGLAFLAKLMAEKPMPVVVVSAWATIGAQYTLRALELGAVDFVTKPVAMPSEQMWDITEDLLTKVKTAAAARISLGGLRTPTVREPGMSSGPRLRQLTSASSVCCIAASTGGPRALQSIVTKLPADFPFGVLLVQHMPVGFTKVFADRLTELSCLPVREAEDGDDLIPGRVLVAPSGKQTRLVGKKGSYHIEIGNSPQSVYKPSADITFQSVADACGEDALGVILTGMGQDGAKGLLAMHKQGARTLAEAESTCVVYGMPRAAIENGAVEVVLPLWDIPEAILSISGVVRSVKTPEKL
jgi:two-component system, chemotaxis family, protein-glutamate methylesterase/glutaminase